MLGFHRPEPPITRPGPLPEIMEPVDLCWPDGRLRPQAVGWTRHPMHRGNLKGRSRNKRWEYWGVMSPEAFIGVTVSDLDYAALHAIYVLESNGTETVRSALLPLSRVELPDTCGGGPVSVRAKDLAIDMVPRPDGVDLTIEANGIVGELAISRPEGHEALGVVVPWKERRFQYTVKENTLPARGYVTVEGRRLDFGDDSWATLDHGRGRWPYRITWNWGAGSGIVDGRTVGVQVGGAWTDGTGSTENAVTVDGVVHYIPYDLTWTYDREDWMRPWRVEDLRSGRVDLTFTPEHVRAETINLGILANDTHQAFGTWSGLMRDSAYNEIRCDGIRGWAEEVRNRW